jgi:hypothetical protein
MALDFPNTPVDGQVYDNFIYDASKGTWKSLSSGASPNYLVNPTITDAVIAATANTASTVPITVKGAASQTANLQEWKNSSGVNLLSIDPSGNITSSALLNTSSRVIATTPIDSGTTGGVGIKAPSGGTQSSAILQFVNNAYSAEYAYISASPSSVVTISGAVTKPSQPVYAGSFANYVSTTSNYFPATTDIFRIGFSKSGNNRLTAQVAGKYYVSAQQLVNTVGTSTYFQIMKNGTVISYAYSNADDTYDVITSSLIELQVNDYIEIFYAGTTTYSWPIPHSYYSVFKVS